MDQDGSDQHRLTAVPANTGFNPRWSPDGTMLALLRYDDSGARPSRLGRCVPPISR